MLDTTRTRQKNDWRTAASTPLLHLTASFFWEVVVRCLAAFASDVIYVTVGAGMISTDRVLITSRCALRYPQLVDARFILEVVTHPDFPRELPFAQLTTLEAVEGAISRRQQRWCAGTGFSWCVDERASGRLVGMVSINREVTPAYWSLAFWIHPVMWRRGFATEIGAEALRLAFSEFGAEMVEAGAAMWNAASQGVLEKLGFTFSGENPDGYRVEGRPVHTREYDLPVRDWRTPPREGVE